MTSCGNKDTSSNTTDNTKKNETSLQGCWLIETKDGTTYNGKKSKLVNLLCFTEDTYAESVLLYKLDKDFESDLSDLFVEAADEAVANNKPVDKIKDADVLKLIDEDDYEYLYYLQNFKTGYYKIEGSSIVMFGTQSTISVDSDEYVKLSYSFKGDTLKLKVTDTLSTESLLKNRELNNESVYKKTDDSLMSEEMYIFDDDDESYFPVPIEVFFEEGIEMVQMDKDDVFSKEMMAKIEKDKKVAQKILKYNEKTDEYIEFIWQDSIITEYNEEDFISLVYIQNEDAHIKILDTATDSLCYVDLNLEIRPGYEDSDLDCNDSMIERGKKALANHEKLMKKLSLSKEDIESFISKE